MTHTWLRSDWKKTTRLLPLCWSLSRTTTTQFDSIYLKLSPGVTVASPTKTAPSTHRWITLSGNPCCQLSQSCVSHCSSLLFAGKLLDLHSRVPTCSTYMITCHTASGGLTLQYWLPVWTLSTTCLPKTAIMWHEIQRTRDLWRARDLQTYKLLPKNRVLRKRTINLETSVAHVLTVKQMWVKNR